MENLATHWVLSFGRDCDGGVNHLVTAFSNESEAYDTALDLSRGSDGIQYRVTDSFNEVKEYCVDYNLDLKKYI